MLRCNPALKTELTIVFYNTILVSVISYQVTCTGCSITSKSFLARAIVWTNKIVTCGICVARFGNTFVNVWKIKHKFWLITEYNTTCSSILSIINKLQPNASVCIYQINIGCKYFMLLMKQCTQMIMSTYYFEHRCVLS